MYDMKQDINVKTWSNYVLVEHLRPFTPMVFDSALKLLLRRHRFQDISIRVVVKPRGKYVDNKLNLNVTEMNPCEIK